MGELAWSNRSRVLGAVATNQTADALRGRAGESRTLDHRQRLFRLGFGNGEWLAERLANDDAMGIAADDRRLDGHGANDRLVVGLIDIETEGTVGVAHEDTIFQIRMAPSHAHP